MQTTQRSSDGLIVVIFRPSEEYEFTCCEYILASLHSAGPVIPPSGLHLQLTLTATPSQAPVLDLFAVPWDVDLAYNPMGGLSRPTKIRNRGVAAILYSNDF
jgi:hypothetical protein